MIGLSWGAVVGGMIVVVASLVALVLVGLGIPTSIAVNPATRALVVLLGPPVALPLHYALLVDREFRGGLTARRTGESAHHHSVGTGRRAAGRVRWRPHSTSANSSSVAG